MVLFVKNKFAISYPVNEQTFVVVLLLYFIPMDLKL